MLPWADFRGFLAHLEKQGEMLRIPKPVDPIFEVAAYTRKSSDVDGPAFLFENVTGYPGYRVAGAVHATPRRIAACLETSIPDALRRYREGLQRPVPPVNVTDTPCQEIVWTGADVDLERLPIVKHSEKDAGRYITAGVQMARDPETGIIGLGMHRMLVQSRDELGLWAPGERRIGRAFLKAEQDGSDLPIAIVIGVDPAVILASVARVPHSQEKLAIAGGLRGGPIEMAPAVTIDVPVPAAAEVIIEGRVLAGVRRSEAPFGEFTGCHSYAREAPVVKVSAITMRERPIYHDVLTGFPVTEDHLLNWLAMCDTIHACASLGCPEVTAVTVVGNYVYEAIVAIRKRMEREPYNVLASVLGGPGQVKYCMVVDDDIDVFDAKAVNWAYCTRVQPHKDVHIFPVMVGAPLDPSAPIERHTSKMGIDATIPLDAPRERFEKCIVPGADRVEW